MPVVLSGLDAVRPVTAISALTELGSALHALNEPDHHHAADWAEGIRGSMSARLAEQTAHWRWATQAIRASPFLVAGTGSGDFADEVARLRAAPPARVARGLLRPIAPSGDDEVAARWARSRDVATRARVDALRCDPGTAVEEFVDFVERSWEEWFGAEWRRVRLEVAASARRIRDLVAHRGSVEAVASLEPAVTVVGDDSVSIAKVQNRRHDMSRRGLVCVPSTWIRPHVYIADVPGRPLLLIHPADQKDSVSVPSVAELMRRLEAASHPGRLEVARAISTEPRTAGEIADLWSLDPTLVNRHLRTLAAAGLATMTRRGRFVQYALDAEAVDNLGAELRALLLR